MAGNRDRLARETANTAVEQVTAQQSHRRRHGQPRAISIRDREERRGQCERLDARIGCGCIIGSDLCFVGHVFDQRPQRRQEEQGAAQEPPD